MDVPYCFEHRPALASIGAVPGCEGPSGLFGTQAAPGRANVCCTDGSVEDNAGGEWRPALPPSSKDWWGCWEDVFVPQSEMDVSQKMGCLEAMDLCVVILTLVLLGMFANLPGC